ncbi:MAG: hypothetical protein WBO29_18155 [Albidovulum sp.]
MAVDNHNLMRFLSVLSFFVFSVSAQAESWLEDGMSGFQTCLTQFPESKPTHDALKAENWRFEANLGSGKIYTKQGRRAIILTGRMKGQKRGCAVIVRKLAPDQAVALARRFLAQANSVKDAALTDADSVAEWTAIFNGRKVRFVATRSKSLTIIHGAAVLMLED